MFAALCGVCGRRAEFFAPDFTGAFNFRDFERLHGCGHRLGLQAFGLQFVPDARCAEATGAAVDDGFDDAGFADEVFGLQIVKHFGQLTGLFFMRGEFAFKLGA